MKFFVKDFNKWKDENFEEMESTLAVQQVSSISIFVS
jgi:hypothetical protein